MDIDILKETFLKWIMTKKDNQFINSKKGLVFLVSHCSCIDVEAGPNPDTEFFVLTAPSENDEINLAYRCIGYMQDFEVLENTLIDLDTGEEIHHPLNNNGRFVTGQTKMFDFRPILPEFVGSILKRVNPYEFEKFLMENV